MLTDHLTKPISPKLFLGMFLITIGAEITLYLNRYSYFFSTIYDAIMIVAFFIGIKLNDRLNLEGNKSSFSEKLFLFFMVSSIFITGSILSDLYTSNLFKDFNNSYIDYVESYSDSISIMEDSGLEKYPGAESASIFDTIDLIGYDLYTDLLAGLEEVWRLSYIIFILLLCKFFFPIQWNSGKRDRFLLTSVFMTSILFGMGHALSSETDWQITIGTVVTYSNMGLLFALLLLWSRSLWTCVIVHSLYDVTATLSYHYVEYAVLYYLLLSILGMIVISVIKRLKDKNQVPTVTKDV
ncbi:type II CAAX prenyl endopeptidase Rce1 family protein [Peribacillus alkalitolerans]|uniref:CPBP family glutamic-type intramembrane protease n=1 Tax=Peribacillus alkalitolerans TaxID=1550385 RepID=UPI0013D20D25|nr:CPBP family glutamic-type intramembrane protease [Peribacillus alkalitolerans]